MPTGTLEEMVAKVKPDLEAGLKVRDYTAHQFFEQVYSLLLDCDLIRRESSLLLDDLSHVESHKIGVQAIMKMNLRFVNGFRNRYVLPNGVPLLAETKEDIERFNEVQRETEAYLMSEFGNRQVRKDQFERVAFGYLKSRKDLTELYKDGFSLSNKIRDIYGPLANKFNIRSQI